LARRAAGAEESLATEIVGRQSDHHRQCQETIAMHVTPKNVFRRDTLAMALLISGFAAAVVVAPAAAAGADCSPGALSNTVGTTTDSARQYLQNHPDANDAVTASESQPRPVASADLRDYFTAHPQEYYDLRGILAPIRDAQRQCNTTLLPPDLASAYDEFMAG
jgi:hemophore-related protein